MDARTPATKSPSLALGDPWALSGNVRGALMAGWADGVRRRYGPEGLRAVTDHVGERAAEIPFSPSAGAWLPIASQIAVTEAIKEVHLRGDDEALYEAMLADTRRSIGRAGRALLAAAGPRRIVSRAPRLFPTAYDVGSVEVELLDDGAVLRFRDAGAMTHPTWQLLQRHAWRVIHAMCGVDMRAEGAGTAAGYDLRLEW